MNETFVIFDTNCFVKHFSGKLEINEKFYLTDMNLCELLKGPIKSGEQFSKFKKIDNLVKQTKSEYVLCFEYSHFDAILNSSAPIKYRFKIAKKIAKKSFARLFEIYGIICMVLISILYAKINQTLIKEGTFVVNNKIDIDVAKINNIIVCVWNVYKKNNFNTAVRTLFKGRKEEIDYYWVDFCNSIIRSLNPYSSFSLKEITEKHFNHNSVVEYNNLQFSKDDVEKSVEAFIVAVNNCKETKEFIKTILLSILLGSKKMEFNDVCDNYLEYISHQLGSSFISGEKKYKK